MLKTLIDTIRRYVAKTFQREPETIRQRAVRSLYHAVKDYSAWYDNHGLYLPPDFHDRPADWNEELHKMVRAFELLYDEQNKEGDLMEAESLERIAELNKQIIEGFTAFGLQLFYLDDPKKRNQ